MGERPIARLGVARLEELAPDHRYREGQPMHGYCLVSGDGRHWRVTLYMENGRPLSDRSGQGGFYYEGWLVGPAGPVSLGAFNLGPTGEGSATRLLDGATLPADRTERVRVTAEPFGGSTAGSIAVLEGRVVWLETGVATGAPPAAGTSLTMPDEAPVETPGSGGVAGQEGAFALQTPTAPATDSTAEADIPEAAGQAAVAVGAVGPSEENHLTAAERPASVREPSQSKADRYPPDVAAPADQPPAEDALPLPQETRSGATGPNQADGLPAGAETRPANPLEVNVQLVQRHPLVPRGAGVATLNVRQGRLTLMLRGLPTPTALGRDHATGRPFNAYRVWLVNRHTQLRTPLGFCHRAWGENFRFEAEGVPLHRHDAILVTVEDRTAPGLNSMAPQVLMGTYQV